MKRGQEWSEAQLDYLFNNYPGKRAEDIGKVIGKTKSSVQHKANRLGIKKDREAFFEEKSKAMRGEHSGNFKGYRQVTSRGYITRTCPGHPYATKKGLVMEHRLVVEEHLGFALPPEFDVHHINGNKKDNRIENLAIMTHGAHTAFHERERRK